MAVEIRRVSFNKEWWVAVYYAILMTITILIMKPEIEYSNTIRFAYMAFVFLPLLRYKDYIPMVVTVFYWFSFSSFCPLLPQEISYTTFAVLLLSFATKSFPKLNFSFLIVTFFFFIVSLVHLDFEYSLRFWMALPMVFLLSSYLTTVEDLEKLAYGFVICSLSIALMFLIYREQLTYTYFRMDRTSWINPNMLGASVGLGVVVSFGLLFSNKKKSAFIKTILILTPLLSLVVLLMNASRGALASTFAGSIVMVLLNKKIKLIYKFLIVAIGIGTIVYMFNHSYMELLMFRMEDEGTLETGGLRFEIWETKLSEFFQLGFFDLLFGIGQTNCVTIGLEHRTHNDFLSALLSYGFIGLTMFVVVYFYPLFSRMNLKKTLILLPYYMFLLAESFVLEPLMRGYMFFMAFYMFIYKYSKLIDKGEIL